MGLLTNILYAKATDCVYTAKQKPGLKPGAVEALGRRIILDDTGIVRARFKDDDAPDHGHTFHRENTYADKQAMHRVEEIVQYADSALGHQDLHDMEERISRATKKDSVATNPLKRKLETPMAESWLSASEAVDISQHLPPQPVLEKVAAFFCVSFHHWIPYLHKQRLQTRVREGAHDAGLALVLHALVAVCLRHMEPNVLFLDVDELCQQSRVSRMIVETHAIRNVTIESLQALILLVFDLLNDGQTQRAWPLIGSLTRTIDYLQLTTEPSTSQSGSLMTPVRLVRPSNDWTELEERRRLFWIIFLLDRFCSVSTGWNTSLTAEDVHRRLPADGGYFTREEPVTTPYFGIWNKAAARIGRSLANVPAQYNEDDPTVEQPPGASPSSANSYIDASKLGAFAYCVEATESLRQVTTFFLQQQINWQDKEHAVSWLTRFKELDLRLVQWKMFLPHRWKDSNISPDSAVIDMDPNLTLAHITHNTSMILLHHPIAYPPKSWNSYVALPKECSAQTCELAAVETSNIVDKFLAHTPIPFVNVQFAFCTFIAAKALLFENQATRRSLRPEFQRLIRSLWEMATRWGGKIKDGNDVTQSQNQAGMYANHLERLCEACQGDIHFGFDFYDHSGLTLDSRHHGSPDYATTPPCRTGNLLPGRPSMGSHTRQNSINSSQPALSPRRIPPTNTIRNASAASPTAYEQHQAHFSTARAPSSNRIPSPYLAPRVPIPPIMSALNPGLSHASFHAINAVGNQQSVQDQSLLNLSDAFMDSHFLDMDRVITFEDTNFFLPGDAYRWH
ncbi:hypothetical protein EJ02DRAFT_445373 [Clathrospora elynae]|uniref:Xylanolytic transcriptional activator regulatory domain-containing protein n=1 Tax=Clathrospora elynae TaxID=706981 RepID=A0A6A5SL89_9PLEO|nr:hypothetical protein EJ02DRAFT_445373 [Clathrospora elynae]